MAKSFHCDFCGEAVSPDEERCPGCGRFFRAVRCPLCAYTAQGKEFVKGCPNCGYLSEQRNKKEDGRKKGKDNFLNISRLFAWCAMAVLAFLLVYFLFLLSRT